jgi:hypothetical protein
MCSPRKYKENFNSLLSYFDFFIYILNFNSFLFKFIILCFKFFIFNKCYFHKKKKILIYIILYDKLFLIKQKNYKKDNYLKHLFIYKNII